MTTKATDSVLNLVSPPISNMVLSQGTLDNVVIGQTTPNTGKFTSVTDTALASALVGAPAGTLVGVGISSDFVISGNTLKLTHPPLLQGATLWVRSDGNDGHDGTANDSAHAFLTLNGAITYVKNNFFLSAGTALTIRIGLGGTYNGVSVGFPACPVFIIGNSGIASQYVINGGIGFDVVSFGGLTSLTLQHLTVNNLANTQNWISVSAGGSIFIDDVIFSCSVTNNTFGCMVAFPGGTIICGNATFQCNAGSAFFAHGSGASVNLSEANASTYLFQGGPAYSVATAIASDLGYIVAGIANMSGVASGQRFIATTNGGINSEGQGINFFPGTIAGVTSVGGFYEA